MALCSDLLVVEDRAKIGYPPARVWGVPTSALWAFRVGPARAKRLLLTGDSIDGTTAAEWGLAAEAAPAAELDERFEALLDRVARVPINQLVMHKLLVNQALYAQGLHATQVLGTFFDGIARICPHQRRCSGLRRPMKWAREWIAARRWLRVAGPQPRRASRSSRKARTRSADKSSTRRWSIFGAKAWPLPALPRFVPVSPASLKSKDD